MSDSTRNPVLNPEPRQHITGEPGSPDHLVQKYTLTEVQLANRNSGVCLETLRHDVTPIGMHYLLTHFDVPYVEKADDWKLTFERLDGTTADFDLERLKDFEQIEQRVTLECAGNGRVYMEPRWASMPWSSEAVGTAVWGGVRLSDVLTSLTNSTQDSAHLNAGKEPLEWVFSGADQGVDNGHVHHFERSLSHTMAMNSDVMLAWQINGQSLPPQHGFPLRLIVPGWYGMASVKWLKHIKAIDHPFEGYQQTGTYQYRQTLDDPGKPVTAIRVRSLMIPPAFQIGIPGNVCSTVGKSLCAAEHGLAMAHLFPRLRLVSTASGTRRSSSLPRTNMLGRAGNSFGNQRRVNMCCNAVQQMPMVLCSRSMLRGIRVGSATTLCIQ